MYGRYTEDNDLGTYAKKHAKKIRKINDPNENPFKRYSKYPWRWRLMRKLNLINVIIS